ncbi:MAG: CDP-alcohol phosphatidyltransferase family protein [Steroidobacteraceae bacterium]
MSLRQIPNLLCLARIALVYPVAHGILVGDHYTVLALFFIAAFTDALDGFLAKRYGWATELGKHLDPLADKLLLVSVFVCLWIAGLTPGWLTATVLLRDVVIVAGAIAYRIALGPLHGQPTPQSKLNTCCQVLYVLAVVAQPAFALPEEPATVALGALAFVTTAVSGLDYVFTYSRRAVAAARMRAAAGSA